MTNSKECRGYGFSRGKASEPLSHAAQNPVNDMGNVVWSSRSVCSPMADDNGGTAGQAQPNEQEQGKYHARSYGDSLQKNNYQVTQVHRNIVQLSPPDSDVTTILALSCAALLLRNLNHQTGLP